MRRYFGVFALLLCCMWVLVGQRQPVKSGPPSQQDAPRLEPSKLEAQELADILGISVWTFRYSGGRVRCWLEIDENGNKTKKPPDGVQDPNKGNVGAKEGKILLWWRREQLALRVQSRASAGNYVEGLAHDSLWWGWKTWSGSVSVLSTAGSRKPGSEITLLRYEAVEIPEKAKDPKQPRKVTIVLKALFPEEPE
jgi:hypothetical protein